MTDFNLNTLTKKLKKKYGSLRMADSDVEDKLYIKTGNKALDLILGGGIAWGYVSEIAGFSQSGKTSLLQIMLANAQKDFGAVGIWIDREKAWFNKRAESLGVDTSNVIVIDPLDIPTVVEANQFVDDTLSAIPDDVYKFICIDSISAFAKTAKSDKSDMGKRALQVHDLFRMITKFTNNKTSVNFANHKYYRPDVMFGCLHADCNIPFVDGRSFTIKEIVDKKIEGEVFSYDEETKSIKPSKIINWFNNGEVTNKTDFISFITETVDTKNSRAGVTCTKNHKILTNNGWKEAKDITIDDLILTKYKSILNNSLSEFVCGTTVADASIIKCKNRNNYSASMRIEDGVNIEYRDWKLSKLSKFITFNKVSCTNDLIYFYSNQTYEFLKLKDLIGKRNPAKLADRLSWLSLAMMYMDDGHFDDKKSHCRCCLSYYRFRESSILDDIALMLKTNFNINCSINYRNGKITINKESFLHMCKNICKYVPESMQYKLPDEFKNKYIDFELKSNIEYIPEYMKILSISEGSERKFRLRGKYDIQVENYPNYLVGNVDNGIIVHNSKETTGGGEAPKYYTTYRIQLEDRKQIHNAKENNAAIGNWIKATVNKTRTGPNYRSVTFPHFYESGIPELGGYARMLVGLNYAKPTNKTEFKSFKSNLFKVVSEAPIDDKVYNEFDIEELFEKHPELIFDEYPPFNNVKKVDGEEDEEENDEFELD